MKRSAISKAVDVAGGQAALARMLGVSRSTVNSWVKKRNRVTAETAKKIEVITGIKREDLRPDLFTVLIPEWWGGIADAESEAQQAADEGLNPRMVGRNC